ncbi:MAG: dipeptidyl aminopeptidase/acylaminoacyl peptidase [Roseivirga sp.]
MPIVSLIPYQATITQTSAVFFADRVVTPHLIILGEGDWNLPGTTLEMYYALRRLGKDLEWVNYMKGGHGAGLASIESDYYDQWARIFKFYEKHFNPKKKEDKDKEVEIDQGN